MITCTCDGCGVEFLRYPGNMKPGKQYCSKACHIASSRVKRVCARCGQEFSVQKSKAKEGKGVFCSRECKGSSREVPCKKCGKRFRLASSGIRPGGNYCSRECHYSSHGRVPYEIMDGVIAIPLTQGKVALIDKEDLPLAESYSWCAWPHRNTTYAQSRMGALHALIMQTPKGMVTDHINGNGLDNRRRNLRIVTNKENLNNLHIHRMRKAKQSWRSQ